MRTEMDMASMKGTKMPPEAVAHMKQMGLDRNVTIYRGDKKLLYMLYPGLKAYCEINPQQFQQPEKSEQKAPKTEVTKLGQETLDGHPCTKSKITITGDDGVQHEILAWQANDLHEFPIKTEMQAEGATVTMHFRDVKLSAPDASLFEPPGDYKHYGSMQEMMMNSMQHMMPQGMPPMPRGHEEQ
jgi:hypothetical protein